MSESQSAADRLGELYAAGGLGEVARGIRDTVLWQTSLPVHRLYQTFTLTVNDYSVAIQTRHREDLCHAAGHGEQPLLDDLTSRITTTDVVWDIGANIGTHALLAAAAGADTVTAFEPGPRARGRLVENIITNDMEATVSTVPYALADWTGTGGLTHSDRTGTRELTRDESTGDAVPVSRAGDLEFPQPSVVKIDVEGGELAVLDGFTREQLAAVRLCYVEVHASVDASEVKTVLNDHGFEVGEVETTREHAHVRGVRQ